MSSLSDEQVTRERPIIFSGPIVKAILAGTKTQTRKVVTPQPAHKYVAGYGIGRSGHPSEWGPTGSTPTEDDWRQWAVKAKCPLGVVGDRLWVRETYCLETDRDTESYPPPHSDGRPVKWTDCPDWGRYWTQPHYRATDPTPELAIDDIDGPGCRWRPSIHMPRWASRITLEITDVRVQRLQEISEEDAEAEGVFTSPKNGHGWDSNPWVWAITFRRLTP